MPQYRYTALAQNGVQVAGERAAVSVQALELELQEQGLYAQRIRPKPGFPGLVRRHAVRPGEFLLFVQELTALMRAGLPLPEVLELAADRPSSPALGQVLTLVLRDIRAGLSFSSACAAHADTFDALFLAAVRTGETTGELPAVLARYQEFLRRRVMLRKKVSQALAYPVFLLLILLAILGLLFAFVMPRFAAMYANFNASLPAPTQWLLAVVQYFPWIAMTALILTGGLWTAWRLYVTRPAGRLAVDAWTLRVPLLGASLRTQVIVNFARNLSTLLAGGTPLLEGLRIVQASFPNRAAAARVRQVAQGVEQGESLAFAVQAAGLLPETAVKMIRVGEAGGGLDGMLSEVAHYYEEILDTQLARLMALVEPVLVLFMGLLIGGIIIVMYLPIFNLAEVIR